MLLILLAGAAFASLLYAHKAFQKYLLIYYLGGVIFALTSSIEVFWFFDQFHDGDQDYFIAAARDFMDSGIHQNDIDFSYFFYKLFVFLASPFYDYLLIGIFAKICFALIWGLTLFSFFNQVSFSKRESLILLLLISIGWYFSTFVLRDGFAALGFMTFFAGISISPKRWSWVIFGILLLVVTRVHIAILIVPSLLLLWLIHSIKLKISPSYFVVGIFLLGLIFYKVAPIPKAIVAPLGIILLPDGESAEGALPYPRSELALTYLEGDQKAKDTMIGFWVSRFPSIFYEPNPFRYFIWPFMGEFGKETFIQMLVKSISSFSSILVLGVFLSTFLIDRDTFYSNLGDIYLLLTLCLFFVGSVYAIKYFGMTTRIYYGFLTGYLSLFFFKPVSNRMLNNNLYPVLILLVAMNLMYFILKPFDWIWNYL
ncbi:hypothetical protein [Cyclobacterium plantarum]|uniref:hypothetical protein n=1 Tax=Cyclobacterium plantarum TaxID=2716263 RepID=UPI003F70D0C4